MNVFLPGSFTPSGKKGKGIHLLIDLIHPHPGLLPSREREF
jgi:hypothetical protein